MVLTGDQTVRDIEWDWNMLWTDSCSRRLRKKNQVHFFGSMVGTEDRNIYARAAQHLLNLHLAANRARLQTYLLVFLLVNTCLA